jgi:hypothetical protein
MPLQEAIDCGHTSYCNATIMYRADFMKKYLPLDDFIQYHFFLQDWTAWIILAGYTDFDIIEDSTATFGIETVSITRPMEYEKLQERLDKEYFGYKYVHDMFPNLRWDEPGWYTYVNSMMMNLAFKRGDYKKARQFAKKSGERSLKVLCAQSWLTFQMFRFLKSIKCKVVSV